MDTRKRSWVKSITWRVVGVVILGVISYAITRDWSQTTVITAIFHGVRLFLYYTHERIWERVDWGRVRHPLSHVPLKEDITREDIETIRRWLEDQEYVAKTPDYQI